ncbi:uncharacterized protein AMSG_10397 [Thecamonas trahens ATCC 50062]|uniref:Large ribosomal subunit protein uL6 alpha-beta domain-containing protein n=1 Tax=Thecamonas trahens ATCC 50062 TaxID=461836 RepID=A0A0L0DSW8_THETB|nr:hypothetical protein AMSG_10397 [Thecamonas trahens ATCC 50062]KNC54548.1 hypothetical protein AMSG_10397 [Thecamonas trahens ATCC 50062]|eukprot:XP_013753563.1 hypothetical protein AMSG_10397 [Thecamonas trahens ATCC 50062]
MKIIQSAQFVDIPEGVTVTIKSRNVTVTGPRGTLTRRFNHQMLEMELVEGGKKVMVQSWHSNRKKLACIRTTASHVQNMIVGVTQGYRYKMRLVYAHFPINTSIVKDGKEIEIRNFLGEKRTRVVPMREGVIIKRGEDVKDELILEGNDVEKVSLTCSDIYGSTLVKNKDIRKFLDGVYKSESGPIPVDE